MLPCTPVPPYCDLCIPSHRVPYLAIAKTFEAIEDVSGRLKMIEILSNLFRSVIALTPGDLLQCVYLCLNKLAPAYEGIELGIGESLLMKVIAQTTGIYSNIININYLIINI